VCEGKRRVKTKTRTIGDNKRDDREKIGMKKMASSLKVTVKAEDQ
jgi:hypothetical protein